MDSTLNQPKGSDDNEACMFAMQLASLSVLPMALKATIELGVLEIIAKAGPGACLSTSEISSQLPTQNPEAATMLDLILRLLASYSVLTCSLVDVPGGVERQYGLAPVCKFLVKNQDGVSISPLVLMNQDKVLMESWCLHWICHVPCLNPHVFVTLFGAGTLHLVCYLADFAFGLEGGIPFNKAYGMTAFDYHGTDPRFNKVFNRGMSDHSTLVMKKILETYSRFQGLKELVDVGGGVGATLNLIISKYHHIKGINFYLQHVIEDAPSYPGGSSRCSQGVAEQNRLQKSSNKQRERRDCVKSSQVPMKKMLLPRAILLLAGLIFLGYLMIWIVIPLKIWLNTWLFTMVIKTRTKEFGRRGTFMLIYTVPILLIAVLGCVYLHLTRNARNFSNKIKGGGPLAELRKPILVRGPLGVVSAMELIFFFLFIALIVWTFAYANIIIPVVDNMNARENSRHAGDKMWQQKLRSTAFYMAIAGNICSVFLFFPVTRGSSILPLLGLTSEGSIKYHSWIGHLAMFFFTMHSIMFVVYWAVTNDLVEMLKWDQNSVSNIPGEIAILFGLALWVTVHPRIRRKMFELFFYTHHLYIPFMFFYMLHTGFYFFCIILPGFYLFLVDRYLRFLQSCQKVRLISARILPCETVELNFSKSLALDYTTTSFMSINVPSISSLQWHPYTISSNSSLEPDRISVIIKRDGHWSQKLYEKLASSSPLDRLEVSIEGPYGPTSADFLRYGTLVMVAGGSGISPMISIIRELIFRKANIGCPPPRLVLICAFKHFVDLTLLDLILPLSGTSLDISQLEIEIEAFVTRDKGPASSDQNNHTKTIWFRPHPSDEAFSATLGSYGWLWLGAIISSSFFMFLLITGLLGRFYIYPKDKNTNKFYSWTARGSLNALILCVTIIATATVAVLWNKRKHGGHISRVQSVELESPTSSPNAWFHNADRELESLPDQSIAENTKVHYGARPNLKKILLEYEGSRTGVLVCGPAKMRHEVAKICASGLYILHYESISYNS